MFIDKLYGNSYREESKFLMFYQGSFIACILF